MIELARRFIDSSRALLAALSNPAARRAVAANLGRSIHANRVSIAISLLLATAIYFAIHERPMEEFVRTVAVKVRGAPANSSVGIDPPTVRVVFRGSREDMAGLDMSPPVIYAQYSAATSNENGVVVRLKKKRDVKLSGMRGFGSVAVVSLEPDKVTLVEDQEASIGFDIDPPPLVGTPYGGYLAEIIDYSPTRATVRGGSRRLKGWTSLGYRLQLPPVSVEGRAESFSSKVNILPPKGEDAMDVTLPATQVEVNVRIVAPRDNRTLEDIPVRLSLPADFALPEKISVSPTHVNMTLVGVREQIDKLAAGDVAVYAEVAADSLPQSATNGVEVALVPRIPQDKSIFEVNLTPPSVVLTPTFPAEPEAEPGAGEGPDPAVAPAPEPESPPAPGPEAAAAGEASPADPGADAGEGTTTP